MRKIIHNFNFVLVGMILLGFVLRIVNLDSNPMSMHADEADTGYTALSLITTGMDPYGNRWPLHFQDQALNYRSPLYTYSAIPSVFLFGLSPFAERLPSVIFGTLLIYVLYLLSNLLFKNRGISLFVALVTAINPWAIHLSRTGLEVMLSLLLTASGVLFFYYAKKHKTMLVFSSIAFSLSLFSYHPAKIFSPIMSLLLVAVNYRFMLKVKKYVIIALFFFIASVCVLGYLAIFDKGASHLGDVSIFNQEIAAKSVDELRTRTNAPLSLSGIFQNKPLFYLREFTNSYIGPLSVNYLFINGESNLDKGIGSYGQFHFFEIITFVIGIVFLWKRHRKILYLLLAWVFIGLIPAAITRTGNYAYRDVSALAPLILIVGCGYYSFMKYIFSGKKWFLLASFSFLTLLGITYFIFLYYFSYPVYSRDWWGYSQKEALEYVAREKENFDTVLVDGGFDWPVLYAFYNNIPPHEFQKYYEEFKKTKIMQVENVKFGIFFNDESQLIHRKEGLMLIVSTPDKMKGKVPKDIFYAVDGGANTASYEIGY